MEVCGIIENAVVFACERNIPGIGRICGTRLCGMYIRRMTLLFNYSVGALFFDMRITYLRCAKMNSRIGCFPRRSLCVGRLAVK